MTKPIHNFKPVKKDRLFYDQFRYCVSFYLVEVNCLRVLDHAHIDDMLARRKVWREIAQQRWKNGTILSHRWNPITETTATNLHGLADILLATPHEFKLVVSVNQAYVYTNQSQLIDDIDRFEPLGYKSYSEAVLTRPKNSVQLKKSPHGFRSYFKSCTLTARQKDSLMDFLYAQREHVRVSPALQRWIDQPFTRTQDYFFIDHETESWLTMLNLIYPGITRKTMHIISAK